MMRLTWRQHWVALLVLLTLSVVAVTALVISGLFERSIPAQEWRYVWQGYGPNYVDLAVQAIPLVGALFLGVHLIARELEDGTDYFAWTQGYSKARWVLGKLAAAAAVLLPMAVGLGLVFAWWFRLYAPLTGYFSVHAFALYPAALAGWTIAGLTMGTAAAALTRRAGRAMVLTLAGWFVLHHFAIVGSPRTPPSEFWWLQFGQLAILLAISALLAWGAIVLMQGARAKHGVPRLLRALPRRVDSNAQVLARQLDGTRLMAVPRVAWRQHWIGLLVALTLLGIYVATLVMTGLHIRAEPAGLRPQYVNLTGSFASGGSDANYALPLLLPFVVGAILGGSLTGPDLEHGTIGFAWAQGVTRARWVVGKMAAVGCVLVVAAIAAGLVFQWWDQAYLADRLSDPWFALYAPVYAGWMAVTLVVAAFLGVLLRSRIGAAVTCFFGVLVAAYANAEFLRSHYLPTAVAVNRPAPAGSLIINWSITNVHALPGAIRHQLLVNVDNPTGWGGIGPALTRYHATSILTYQPASQFWQLQAIESAGLLLVTLLIGAATVWLVRRQES